MQATRNAESEGSRSGRKMSSHPLVFGCPLALLASATTVPHAPPAQGNFLGAAPAAGFT
ncbi:MAG: hypothetical protein MUC60_06015 [Oscillatoria sp. Prado101]|nr:hypothetical protein [Oscillatoria sp. Prado101]